MGIIHELTEQLYSGSGPTIRHSASGSTTGSMRTNLMPELVESVLTETGATFWLELGSMIGGSAIVTANVVKRLGTDTGIVCMDPFCGDVPDMWSWEHNDRAREKLAPAPPAGLPPHHLRPVPRQCHRGRTPGHHPAGYRYVPGRHEAAEPSAR